jgi:VanZ family protein
MSKKSNSLLTLKFVKITWYWMPPFIWAAFIYFLSSRTAEQMPQISFLPFIDKAAHTLEYGVLGFLTARAFLFQASKKKYIQLSFIAFILCVAYGYADELHQKSSAGRSFEWFDLIADASGALGGIIIAKLVFLGGRANYEK